MNKINLGIIGCGNIASSHLDVIYNIKSFNLYGITSRTNKKSNILKKKYKILKVYKDYKSMILDKKIHALVILVSVDKIYQVIIDVIKSKKPFFSEKPLGLNFNEIKKINLLASKYKSLSLVGFNRRHYSVFHKGIGIIKKKGKLLGVKIEGHERFWKISKKSTVLKENWLYANSSHTIDLLRFFGSEIKKIKIFSKNYNNHKSNFTASILFKNNTLGTYISNWYSPGGWSVTLYGEGVTVFFNPLEDGFYKYKNNKIYNIKPDIKDLNFKPGFFNQMIAFKNLIIKKRHIWPSQNIKDSYKTFKIIEKFKNSNV